MKSLYLALAVLSLMLLSIVNAKPVFACDTEIKKTDGYKELSEKLKCLNTKIELVYKKTPDFDRQTIVLFEPSKPIDIKTKKCLKTSTLPDQFRLVLRDGMKFCQDDGWVWGRGYAKIHYYQIQFTDKRDNFSCSKHDNGCSYLDISSNKKFSLFVEEETFKGKKYFIGNFKIQEE